MCKTRQNRRVKQNQNWSYTCVDHILKKHASGIESPLEYVYFLFWVSNISEST